MKNAFKIFCLRKLKKRIMYVALFLVGMFVFINTPWLNQQRYFRASDRYLISSDGSEKFNFLSRVIYYRFPPIFIKAIVYMGADVRGGVTLIEKGDKYCDCFYIPIYHDIISLAVVSGYNFDIFRFLMEHGAFFSKEHLADIYLHAHGVFEDMKKYVIKSLSDVDRQGVVFVNIIKSIDSKAILDELNKNVEDNEKLLFAFVTYNSNPMFVEKLIERGTDVNAKDEDGQTALIRATRYNDNPKVIEMLMKYGADIKAKDNSVKTALDYAKGNPKVYKTDIYYLMEKMLKDESQIASLFNQKSEKDIQTLMTVVVNSKISRDLDVLIKSGVDINLIDKRGYTFLMNAAQRNKNPEVIETLIKNGADVNARDKDGNTALIWAALYNENPKIIDTLMKYGADIDVQNNLMKTILIWTMLANKNPEVIETLINHGVDVNVTDNKGRTALIWAILLNKNPEVIETLIKHGADVKVKDNEGKTALDYAKKNPKIYQTDVYWKMNDMMYQ